LERGIHTSRLIVADDGVCVETRENVASCSTVVNGTSNLGGSFPDDLGEMKCTSRDTDGALAIERAEHGDFAIPVVDSFGHETGITWA
jgi:hypothetical protein